MSDAKVSVIYYSATGSVWQLAKAVVQGAEKNGAEVRLRKVPELAPEEAIASNKGWSSHRLETQDVVDATATDVTWADAVVFGTPTRYGNVSAQLKQFLDSLGPQWAQGALANKVYSGFVSVGTAHGGHESTLLALYNTIYHFGGIVVAPGYTDPIKFQDGNPYGTSHTSANGVNPPGDLEYSAAMFQGGRVTQVATALRRGFAIDA
ncbi:MAG: putative flavodoxin [Frankiales bacterium]|nr:putative flavodoxin [Frankiales bacterium]